MGHEPDLSKQPYASKFESLCWTNKAFMALSSCQHLLPSCSNFLVEQELREVDMLLCHIEIGNSQFAWLKRRQRGKASIEARWSTPSVSWKGDICVSDGFTPCWLC